MVDAATVDFVVDRGDAWRPWESEVCLGRGGLCAEYKRSEILKSAPVSMLAMCACMRCLRCAMLLTLHMH